SSLRDLDRFAGVPSVEEALAQGIDRDLVLDHARLTFRQAQEFRRAVGEGIQWRIPALAEESTANRAKKALYAAVAGEPERALDRAAAPIGGEPLAQYKSAKLAYAQYKVLDKVAQAAVTRAEARALGSPSTKGVGLSTLAGMLAHGAGGPI